MNVRNLFFHNAWSVGVSDTSARALLAGQSPSIRWIAHPRGDRWFADPFILEQEGKTYILCEEMDVRLNRGRIVSLDLSEEFPTPVVALERPYHLSYPFVCTHKGRSYVVPESCQARTTTLFEVRGTPPRLEQVSVLIDDFAAVDPTLLRHNGSWWLFCTDADGDDNAELHLLFADELHGPWHRHPACPIKRDRASSRPAGTPFLLDGVLYRPAQNCSREYGGAVVLNRVLALDRTHFAEETVARLEPDSRGACPKGLHTLSIGSRLNAVDGKSNRFSPIETLRAVASHPKLHYKPLLKVRVGRFVV